MKETKIIQVYPSDSAIEGAINEWESFGWELKSNQRYSDKSSIKIPYIGKETTTTTYNKLTFVREKSTVWYAEVVALENKYNDKTEEIGRLNCLKPSEPPMAKRLGAKLKMLLFVFSTIMSALVAIVFGFLASKGQGSGSALSLKDFRLSIIFGSISVMSLLVVILMQAKKRSKRKKYAAAYERWERDYHARIVNLERECKSIIADSQKVIDGAY